MACRCQGASRVRSQREREISSLRSLKRNYLLFSREFKDRIGSWSADLIHEGDELGDLAGVLFREVIFLSKIIFDIEEFGTGVFVFIGLIENEFPVSLLDGPLTALFEKFPVKVVVFLLIPFPEKGGNERVTVSVFLRFGT